ncbi:hypothetical protein WMC41_16265 [Shinella yambaruensis]|uniref:hypothetical protein n=1 Tax=Shinella yambaruensis TaxID=415996 RepID=UPI003D7A5D74
MTLAAPRLRPFEFHVGQDVRLRGFQATVTRRLRTATGRAMYAVQLAGEPGTRHVMEDGLQATEQMQVAA